MSENEQHLDLISPPNIEHSVRKDRVNETCKLKAWYYSSENTTYAYAILEGVHGAREDIPEDRVYYICSGEATFTIDDKKFQVAEGSILQIPKHSTYDFQSTGSEPVKFYVDVGFKLDLDKIPS